MMSFQFALLEYSVSVFCNDVISVCIRGIYVAGVMQ